MALKSSKTSHEKVQIQRKLEMENTSFERYQITRPQGSINYLKKTTLFIQFFISKRPASLKKEKKKKLHSLAAGGQTRPPHLSGKSSYEYKFFLRAP